MAQIEVDTVTGCLLPLAGDSLPYHPDRSFDTLACMAIGPLECLAALEKGSRCALVASLESLDVSPALDVRHAVAVDPTGHLVAERLRTWLGLPGDGRLRVVVNAPLGPYLCRPLQMGADVVVEDLSTLFDAALLPAGSGPMHAVVGRNEQAEGRFFEALGLDAGACGVVPAAERAVFLTGLKSLSLLSQRRSDTALAIAHFLAAHPRVAWVSYPGLQGDAANAAARATWSHGFGPWVTFGLVEGEQVTERRASLPLDAARSHLVPLGRGAWLASAGLESPLDVVASLDRAIAGLGNEGLAHGVAGRAGA